MMSPFWISAAFNVNSGFIVSIIADLISYTGVNIILGGETIGAHFV
jgi:hypothetical protein